MTPARYRRPSFRVLLLPAILTLLGSSGASAQVPAEVQALDFATAESLSWTAVPGADFYNVYRGDLAQARSGVPARCHAYAVDTTSYISASAPVPGQGYLYLVTAETDADGEGTAGDDSQGVRRPLLGTCGPTVRTHVLDRIGYGWNPWSADRIVTLGLQAYVDEQLAPETIDESTNVELNTRMALFDPPEDIVELIGRQVVAGVYARRQLEQHYTAFWANHFNTYWRKMADLYQGSFPSCEVDVPPPQCDPDYPARAYREASEQQHRETEQFRDHAFNGSFRQILEASALSPAMIIFLDTYANVAIAPNENYARELLELYAMGVEGGYTQQDVEELARVLTGWNLCKRLLADLDDPLAACQSEYWLEIPEGKIVATFVSGSHDCQAKTLFAGTPQQTTIPDTCANPKLGVVDLGLALDAIANHPSTARFISRKILEAYVTDQPDPAMVDALVAVWDDETNPHGRGDLRELLRAALELGAFLDPDRARSKIKTPLEQFVGAIRGVGGHTDGASVVLDYLVRAQHLPHYNPVPVGYPERGGPWIDTTNTLERQNFGIHLAFVDDPEFGSDPFALLADRGVPTEPGHADEVVDFFADLLFGGALTPAERQAAIEFLNTDEYGVPSPYDSGRVRQLAALLLGYAQFQEQ